MITDAGEAGHKVALDHPRAVCLAVAVALGAPFAGHRCDERRERRLTAGDTQLVVNTRFKAHDVASFAVG